MQVMTRLETKLEEFFKKNVQASSDRCSALLQDIFSPLEDDLKHGIYFKPGGYLIFMRKIQELKKKYYEEPRKGVQVNKVTCVLGSWPSSQYSMTLSITGRVSYCLYSRHLFLQHHVREGSHTGCVLLTHQRQCILSILEFTLDNHINHPCDCHPVFKLDSLCWKDPR